MMDMDGDSSFGVSDDVRSSLFAAIESAGEAVIITDLTSRITYVNPAFEHITQYSRREALGQTPRLLKSERNDPAVYQDLWRTITRGGVWRGSFLNRKKDGSIYRVEQTVAPAVDGEGRTVSYVSIHRDVTDNHMLHDALRLAAAVESAGDSIVLTDLHGTILYVNAAFERINGTQRDKLAGHNLWTLKGTVEDLASPRGKKVWSALTRGETWRGSFQGRRPDGRPYLVEKTVAPVRNAAGAVIGYVSVGHDLTQHYARRQVERRLAAANSELTLAETIQQRLFPQGAPALPGYDIAGKTFPAEHVCGDYFDFVSLRDESLGVVVGDVSGHDLGAALLMVDVRAYLRGLATCFSNESEILGRVNALLFPDIESAGFVTLFFLRLDAARHVLSHAGAGHNGHVVRASGECTQLESTGLPLGIAANQPVLQGAETRLNPGDVVLLMTDGLTDAMSNEGELFGASRAIDLVARRRDAPASAIIEALHAAVYEFTGDEIRRDDQTVVVVKRER